MTALSHHEWLKFLPRDLLYADSIPLWGEVTPFPWQGIAQNLVAVLRMEKVALTPSTWQWRMPFQFLEGMGGEPFIVSLGLSGYEGMVHLLVEKGGVNDLLRLLLGHGFEEGLVPFEISYQRGFGQFLCLEFLQALVKSKWEGGVEPFLAEKGELPDVASLSFDTTLSVDGCIVATRLIVGEDFRRSWANRHIPPFSEQYRLQLAQKIPLRVSLVAGSSSLSLASWKQVSVGDLLLLDQCTLHLGEDPSLREEWAGSLLLFAQGRPLFRAMLERDQVILEEPLSSEEIASILGYLHLSPPSSEDPMSKASESDMSEGEDSEEFSFDEESEEFSFDEEEEKEEPLEEESSDSGEVYENRTLSTPKPSESPSVSAKPEEKLSKPIETEEKGLEKRGGDESSANPLTLEQVPLQIAVEIGRCQMALAKVMQLQPGNLLDLHVHPAEGVDLVVHGQCIGRGELVKLGELLGVRITEIG